MKVLSIDPGFERVGIAVIEKTTKEKDKLIFSTCFKTSSLEKLNKRILLIGEEISKIITKYKPNRMAIEKLYLNTNQKTVMGVAEARGVIIYIASKNNIPIYEYTPPQIKVAVTGYGKANKQMVMSMVPRLIEIKENIKSDDEIDAIAVGLTCLASEKIENKGYF